MRSSTVVAEARRRSGLTQRALAQRARTSQSTIAAYENGTKQPSADTMTRIVEAAGFTVTWNLAPAHDRIVETVRTVADLLDEQSQSDQGHNEAFRVVADLAYRLDHLDVAAFVDMTRTDPGSTGDRRWDALIGGIVERGAHRLGARVPTWTAAPARFLDVWWFVSPYRSLHASAMVEAPPELANRGVFVHASSLSRV